ncbi:hypothetical protein [Lacunimicrobium album]
MSEAGSAIPSPAASSGKKKEDRIYLVSYPKIVFMYPTFLMAIIAGIYMQFFGAKGADLATAQGNIIMGGIFMGIFTMNLIVLAFDFPRATSLTLVFFIVALVLGFYLVTISFPDFLPSVLSSIRNIKPVANASFYYFIAIVLGIIYFFVWVGVQLDYWEVGPNELLHHHGFLSDLERLSAPSMKIDKEINDLFEYILLGSGRLILHPSGERKAIVLDNVFFIGQKEREITRMLSALQVQVKTDT